MRYGGSGTDYEQEQAEQKDSELDYIAVDFGSFADRGCQSSFHHSPRKFLVLIVLIITAGRLQNRLQIEHLLKMGKFGLN
jgi:hypothetical protein